MNQTLSVCMATYNGEFYIRNQLESILIQLSSDDEIIVSDDSSTDRTIEIIKSFKDDRIKLIADQKFRSPVFNFENALKHAKSDYMILSDQDDVWARNKVETFKKHFNDYDLILSDANIIDANGDILFPSFYKINGSKKGLIKNIIKNSYLGCTMAFNRKILEKSLPFPKNIPMHDWWIGLNAELYGKIYFSNDKLISYRRHGNNASPTGGSSIYSLSKKIKFRIVLVNNLLLRYFR